MILPQLLTPTQKENLTINMPTINLLKRRDKWDRDLRIAKEQKNLQERNFHIFRDNLKEVVKRYERWLENHPDVKPEINLDAFKEV